MNKPYDVNTRREALRIVYDILDYVIQEPWSKRWRISQGAYLSTNPARKYINLLHNLEMIQMNDKHQVAITQDGRDAHKVIGWILTTLGW